MKQEPVPVFPAVSLPSEGIPVDNDVGLVGNGFDIRHKQFVRF